MALTGRFDMRRSFWGKIVLRVEEEVAAGWFRSSKTATRRRWRDATLMDLAAPELRPLIDLRFRPLFVPQRYVVMSDTPRAEDGPQPLPRPIAANEQMQAAE